MRQEMAQRLSELEAQQMQEARDQAARIRAEAQSESERLKEQALLEARGELADLVMAATGQVLGRVVDDEERARLVDEAVAELGGQSN